MQKYEAQKNRLLDFNCLYFHPNRVKSDAKKETLKIRALLKTC
jgi:hypothetical protein